MRKKIAAVQGEIAATDELPATRAKLRERLRTLAAKPRPDGPPVVAMCYAPLTPPERVDYVCPGCGERTIYHYGKSDDEDEFLFAAMRANDCRRFLKEIPGLDLELDESALCRQCSPDAEEPELVLIVHYPDADKPHRVPGIHGGKLKLIQDFMQVNFDQAERDDQIDQLVNSARA